MDRGRGGKKEDQQMRDLTIISASVTLVVLIIALVVLVGILKVIIYAV